MTDDHEPRPSRLAWPAPAIPTPELVKRLRLRWLDKLLLVAVVALLFAIGALTFFVYEQQQFIEGRGEYRDRENARLEEQIRRSTCDLLDTLPPRDVLDRPRAKYGCGPGLSAEPPTIP